MRVILYIAVPFDITVGHFLKKNVQRTLIRKVHQYSNSHLFTQQSPP
jgi:hypothetical protein